MAGLRRRGVAARSSAEPERSHTWLPVVITWTPMEKSLSASSLPMPKPPWAFSPLAITMSARVERTRGPNPAKRAFMPGWPITSPIIKALTILAILSLLKGIKRF